MDNDQPDGNSAADDDSLKASEEEQVAPALVQKKEAVMAAQQHPERNADAEFRRGLEELVRDHFDSCMAFASAHDPGGCSGSSSLARASSLQSLQDASAANPEASEDSSEDSEFECQYDYDGDQGGSSEGGNTQESSRDEDRSAGGFSGILRQWYERRAEQVITTMERQARQAELLALAGLHAVSMLDSSFLGESRREQQPRQDSSRLVRIWRGQEDAERELSPVEAPADEVPETSRGDPLPEEEQPSPIEADAVSTEANREVEGGGGDTDAEQRRSVRQIMQRWMSERISDDTNLSRRERNELLDLNERERVRQRAREWLQTSGSQQRHESSESSGGWEAQRRRDRQLILDLLMRTERDRQRELEGLSEHRVVSSFPHRGRLQSFLRGRFLRSGSEQEELRNHSAAATELGQLRQRRAVTGLRDGFRARLERIVRGQADESETSVPQRQERGTLDQVSGTAEGDTRSSQRVNDLQDATAYNMELQELLGRRSVSNILASEFRHRLDHLIRSFIHRQVPWPESEQEQEAVRQEEAPRQSPELNQVPPVPPVPPAPPLPPRQLFWQAATPQGNWLRTTPRRQYTAFESFTELREDISRLQEGLGDLQRMVETCVDMQFELQRSIRQEVAGALQRMYAGRELPQGALDGSSWTPVKKGVCCVCCDKQIESLLYRCGHMCTCLKCATQLMNSGSKCPMCRAPIVEVIRAFTIA